MTHSGYTLKRPTLKSNYIKILQTLTSFNGVDVLPNREMLRKTTGISHDQGFDKALNALVTAGYVAAEKSGNAKWFFVNFAFLPSNLIDEAALNSAKRWGIL